MTTALPKKNIQPAGPHDTLTGQIVRLESATETMMAYIGFYVFQRIKAVMSY